MSRLFVSSIVICTVLAIVLTFDNAQRTMAEDTAPVTNAAPETGTPVTYLDAETVSFKRSAEARVRTIGDRLRDSVSILD